MQAVYDMIIKKVWCSIMSKRKSKKGKKIGIILILLLLISIIGGGYYYQYYIKNKAGNNPGSGGEEPIPEPKLKIVDLDSKSRPFAIMINNIGVARPLQSGLQDAYIIYEMLAEGGITRYMALFLDQTTERIGSVRSSRHYYLDYALENDAIYVHHGQSPQAAADFKTLRIDRIVADNSKTGWRDKTLKVSSEHTLFTSIEKLNKGVGSKRTERNKDLLLDYSIDPIDLSIKEGVKIANKVTIVYSAQTTSSYEYDAEGGVYKRFVNNKEHLDYVTKAQYTFKNIIIYQVDSITLDSKGRQDFKNIGSGKGWFISEGSAVPITWSKSARSSQTVYKYENGEELVVNDGNTFIQIQPKGKELSIS